MLGEISTVSAAADGAAAMKKATGLNKDDFLRLFMAQMQNQDPLNPQDGSQFITQLAQLTQVEQSYNTNSNLAKILAAFQDASSLSLVSFIGKQALVRGNSISMTEGSQPLLSFNLPSAATTLNVEIRDGKGVLVRTISSGEQGAGDGSVLWDGKDDGGKPLPAGTYRFSVTATGKDGSSFSGAPYMEATVTAVRYDSGRAILNCGPLEVQVADLIAVKGN